MLDGATNVSNSFHTLHTFNSPSGKLKIALAEHFALLPVDLNGVCDYQLIFNSLLNWLRDLLRLHCYISNY